ncbi:type VII secretion target [Mycolicibacter hiberniae]|uniref:ESX-1 secretion-associated protein n=1 Tax=Mycolicibacter hiberniae TaxID=29314 RepID=A0A7I7X292_9MYCO|nr:type VII secretion target [Mycolicibacter hiberniae]MCV7084388.1 hypothetical protein [Mycolicibacter hiberniae]BBZ22921.1 hypothetical protein MHIB_13390 [Mycolicibacter hiberniae]
MTSPALRVTPVSLRTLAQRCAALSGQVAPALPAASGSAWQSSGAAARTTNVATSMAATALRSRMTASSAKLATAAHEYETMDNNGAAALAAVPQGGGRFTPLVPRGTGVDGGAAGGLGTPR